MYFPRVISQPSCLISSFQAECSSGKVNYEQLAVTPPVLVANVTINPNDDQNQLSGAIPNNPIILQPRLQFISSRPGDGI